MKRRWVMMILMMILALTSWNAAFAEEPDDLGLRGRELKQTGWWGEVQKKIQEQEYQVSFQEKGVIDECSNSYHAPNRAQNLRTYFRPDGLVVLPRTEREPSWRLHMSFAGMGRGKNLSAPQKPELFADGAQITYERGAVNEWYKNTPDGVEQGFTINTAPAGKGDLVIALKLGKGWKARLAGNNVELSEPGGTPRLQYGKLLVKDARDEQLPAHLETNGGVVRIVIRDRAALYPIVVDPVLSKSPTMIMGGQDLSRYGHSVSSAGDVNGDGYADVIVGADSYDNGQTEEGKVFVYHGTASGLNTTAAWTAEGNLASALFGYSISTAGDVNGDGYADIIIGAPYYSNGQSLEGKAFVYHGSSSGLGATPAWTAEGDQADAYFGTSVSTAGDVNGDGFSDVIVGAAGSENGQAYEGRAFVYHGSASGLSATANWTAEGNQQGASFGISVASAGDVNGDGFADVIVGAADFDNGEDDEGRAYVYQGSPSGLAARHSWTFESNQASARVGFSVASAGDVNGDGFADVIVGSPNYSDGEYARGAAFVFQGSALGLITTPNWSAEGNGTTGGFGLSVATAGDVNGDGFSDVIVGSPYSVNGELSEGLALVYHGSASGLSTTAAWSGEGNSLYAAFGRCVFTAGDVNGDGFADVIVGAPFYYDETSQPGAASVYYGSTNGLVNTLRRSPEGNRTGAAFGYSVSTAGDVNGDGFDDVLVGAPYYDFSGVDDGRVFVFLGSESGPSLTAKWTASGGQSGANFGASVATAGDVNADGYADIIIGAPGYDRGQIDEGRAFIYHGSANGPGRRANWTAESNQAGALFGSSVASAGDVNGDGYGDVIIGAYKFDNVQKDEGRAFVYHGARSGLGTTANWTAESNQSGAYFGYSVAPAGDVNGDGYSDVIIGAHKYDNGEADEGAAFVYHGSASGLGAAASWTAESNKAGAFFGYSVASAGDMNGDGYSDIIIGAPYYGNVQSKEGRALVYHGSASGLGAAPNWAVESNKMNSFFGISVASAGDVNRDGYSDVIIGASGYTNGQFREGLVRIYRGAASGLRTVPSWSLESNQAKAQLGLSAASAGDVNGDGFADVIVGAPYYDGDMIDEGKVFIFY